MPAPQSAYPRISFVVAPVVRFIVGAILCSLYGLRWKGVRQVPQTGAFVLAPNHQSFIDPPAVGIGLSHRRYCYMANEKYFHSPLLGGLLYGLAVFPVDLEARFDRKAYKLCLQTLQEGLGMVIFPEGTRSPDGNLLPLQQGAARIALQTGACIVPCVVTGASDIWPRERKRPRLTGRIRIKYYRPIPVAKCEAPSELGARAAEITKRLEAILGRRLRAYQKWQARRA